MEKKDTVLIRLEWLEPFEILEKENVLGDFFIKLMKYAKNKEVPNFNDPSQKLVWSFVKPNLEYNEKKYEEKQQRNALSAANMHRKKKGLKPFGSFEEYQKSLQAQANASERKQTHAHECLIDTDIDIGIDTDIDIGIDTDIDIGIDTGIDTGIDIDTVSKAAKQTENTSIVWGKVEKFVDEYRKKGFNVEIIDKETPNQTFFIVNNRHGDRNQKETDKINDYYMNLIRKS